MLKKLQTSNPDSKWSKVPFLFLILFFLFSFDSMATHFRYGNVTWRKINNTTNQVEFTITTAWRGNFFSSTIPNLGATVSGIGLWYYGDGSSVNLTGKVTARNVTENWMVLETKLTKTYTTNGNYTAYHSSCCRLSNLLGGAADGNYRFQTIVNIGTTNNSPTSTMPPIINLQRGFAAATFQVPGADPDNDTLRFRLATSAEVGVNPPTRSPDGVLISIDSFGNASFKTTNLSVGMQFAAAVAITDGKSVTYVDFIVNIVAQSTPPVFDYSVTPTNGFSYQVPPGTRIAFAVKASDTDPSSSVTLSAVGVPSGATWNPGSASNPRVDSFIWVPGNSDLGTRVVTFTAQDNNSVQTQTSVTIKVSLKPVFSIPPTPDDHIAVEPGDTVIFTVEAYDPDNTDSVSIVEIEGEDSNHNHVSISSSLYSGVDFTVPTAKANPTSGVFTWVPGIASWGHRPVKFTARDKYNDETEHEIEIIVNTAPVFTSTPPSSNVIAGNTYTYNITVYDPDTTYGDELEIHHSNLPAWLTLTDNGDGTATLTGTPGISDSGTISVQILAEDIHHHANMNGIPEQNFDITVIPCVVNALCKNISIALDQNGSVSISGSDVDNGSTANCGIQSLTLDKSSFNCSNLGTNSVVLTVTDNNNITNTCQSTVTIEDNVAPTAISKNITVQLDANGAASITASDVNDGSNDACGIKSLSIDKSGFDCNNVGANTVTLTVTDNNNNVSTDTIHITVVDTTKPITKAKNITVYLDSTGNAAITSSQVDAGSGDACGITLSLNKTTFNCSNVGSGNSFTDNSALSFTNGDDYVVIGNVTPANTSYTKEAWVYAASTSCDNIISSNQNPFWITGGKLSAGNGNNYSQVTDPNTFPTNTWTHVAVTYDKATNTMRLYKNGTQVAVNTNAANNTGGINAIGKHYAGGCHFTGRINEVRIWDYARSATDIAANTGKTLLGNESGLTAYYPMEEGTGSSTADVTGHGFNGSFVNMASNPWVSGSGLTQSVGGSEVILTGTDPSSNSSTAKAIITVVDNIAPIAICKNITIQLDANGAASITASDVNDGSNDACGIKSLSIDKSTFNCSNLGSNTVTLTVTDNNNNSSSCTSVVTVTDNIAPIAIAKDINAYLDQTGKATITPNDIDDGSTDNCAITSKAISNTTFGCNTANYALAFDGQNDHVKMPNGIVNGLKDFTFEAWVNYTDNGYWTRIFDIGINTTYNMFLTPKAGRSPNVGNPRLAITTGGISGEQLIDANIAMPTGWHHIAVTLDHDPSTSNVVGKMYIDGTLVGQNNSMTRTPSDLGVTTQNLLGKSQYADPYFKQYMDEVRIWSIARSQSQIQSSMSKSLSGSEYGLFVYYDFEDGPNSSTVNDKSPSNNDGTLVNMNTSTAFISPGVINTLGTGAQNVVLTVGDASSNFSSDTAVVTVLDTIKPTLNVTNYTVQLNASGQGSITVENVVSSYSDNCEVASISLSDKNFGCSNVGQNTITITAKDVNNNTTTATVIVTVEDKVAPVAICKNITVQLDNNGTASITASDVNDGSNDACGIKSLSIDKSSFDCNNVGANTVTLTVTDNNDNVSTCQSTVTIEDNVAPTAICKNITVQLDNNGTATISAADLDNGSNDACGIQEMSINKSTFDCTNVGANTVTFTVGDNHMNYTLCRATVTVEDKVAPVAICKNITVQLDNNGTASITASDVNDGSNDACGIKSLSIDKSSFDCNNVGANTVTLTVTDNNDNVSTCQSTVTIEDNVDPVAICKNITVQLDANGAASITASDVNDGSNDACGIKSLSIDKSSFDCNNVGANTVTLTVTDNNDNVSTCQSTVTIEDKVAPTAICKNITVQLDNNGTASITTADVNDGSNDACGIKSLSIDKSSFDCNNVGANTVTLTVTDNNDNVSTCQSTVTIEDKVAPVAICKNITVQLDNNGTATIAASDVNDGSNDACGIKSLSIDKSSFDCNNVGANTVTLTVTDNNNNVSTCQSTVTIEDNVAPTAICKNITVQLDNNGAASITTSDVNDGSNDACGIKSLSIDKSSFDCNNVGANTVTLTVMDNNDNVSTCQSTVTIEDNVAPNAIAQNVSVTLSGGAASVTAAQVDNGSNDACGIKSISVSPNSWDCSQIGDHTVTLTVTDNNNNVSTTTATVSVLGSIPTVSISQGVQPDFCQGGAVVLTASSNEQVSYAWSNSATTAVTDVFASGTYTVTVTNGNGCTATGSTTVNYSQTNLLSSYTILTTDDAKIEKKSVVNSGGVGSLGKKSEIELKDGSKIVATGTFAKAYRVDVSYSSSVTNKYSGSPASVTLPDFIENPYCESCNSKYDHDDDDDDDDRYNCRSKRESRHCDHKRCDHKGCSKKGCKHDNCKQVKSDLKVKKKATVTVSDSIFRKIHAESGSTIIFTSDKIYADEIETQKDVTIKFTTCATVYLCGELKIHEDNKFNPDALSVVVYAEKKVNIDKGTTLNASIFTLGDLDTKGDKCDENNLTGMFISEDLHAHYTNFNWSTTCGNCSSSNKWEFAEDLTGVRTEDYINIYPNPTSNQTTVAVNANQEGALRITLMNMNGQTIRSIEDKDFSGLAEVSVDMSDVAEGMYFIRVEYGTEVKVFKVHRVN